ncbi:hypothetical protein A3A46_01160 [Candidatus Roizmanbacteria bacterium RIFCSPLOWO2_01_FULL_37_13]|uniref:Nickel/cobalt efflux system n=1 Tax=Candidatus Roizmanbacteria bacterium RIFCSPHIGHO2_02_FULL_38_11 TaxID=1802039 RepID=A0A1F7GW65_9BACT|nr:MAG: hypothetical protein A3C25_03855 [Candidatus Roizmanbacteria bacterium RIFCSPHIGHO2_02_FULL_38_11]OGK41549.1 MAG: hypothetical protein A3A46_01160 [Candidatus Roizmanbacteria bacterium RIFCSPLOWO2_01_FULL_37_13]
MPLDFSRYFIFFLAFLLGIRHGIDWDHIAAITDLTGTSDHKKEAFILGLWYIVGHAAVVIILGLIAIIIGINLPEWIDPLMERFVGITLVILGLWLLFSIFRHGSRFQLRSRWMLILDALNRLSLFLHNKIPHRFEHDQLRQDRGKKALKAAFIVGMIHGVGVETPTQVLLFVTAAGVSHSFFAVILLVTFVLGLMLSNTLISVLSILGYAKAKKNSSAFLVLGLITAVISLIVGSLFLFNRGSVLPAILGG